MKTLKQLKEDIANVSAGIGVRGFGDVTGTPKIPKVGEEEVDNPHIDRVMQGADENNALVDQFIKNNTDGIYTWEGGFDWWANRKGVAKYTKTHSAEPLGFTPLTSQSAKEFGIVKEEIGGMAGTVGGTNVGSGYIAGVGVPLEGKPTNWGEPGIIKKVRKKHKKRTKAQLGEVGSAMKEIPIQEEEIPNTTDGLSGLGDNQEVYPGKTKQNKRSILMPLLRRLPLKLSEEIKTGMFANEQTFVVPSHVYEKALHHKQKGKHWRTYIKDEMFHPSIREFAYKNPKKPIIFEDEKTGYMSYARYGKKRKK